VNRSPSIDGEIQRARLGPTMKVRFLGGAREVGRSAILVDDRRLLDCGATTDSPPSYPLGTGASSGGSTLDPDAVVVTHGHLDHGGALPTLVSGTSRPAVHWTPPTRDLALALARDTLKLHGQSPLCPFTREDVARLTEVSETHGYGEAESFETLGYEITLYNAGHIPGSAHVLVDDGETRLLYTGDFSTTDQRLVAPTTDRPPADVVICESTYSDVEHEPRNTIEDRFVERLRETVWEGGTAVVPAFAIGRTQELMLVCAANDITPYVDGMGTSITRTLRQHPEFLRDHDAFTDAISNARFVDGGDGQRRRIARENNVIITTAGMLGGGPAMTYVPEIAGHPTNTVAMTGYQVEGTPGRELLDTGRAEIDGQVMPVSATVEAFDFSAHADRSGLRSLLESYTDARVLVNHGDRCAAFAAELQGDGVEASAPENGAEIDLANP
jgi:putative mRNA 3-end processing factor